MFVIVVVGSPFVVGRGWPIADGRCWWSLLWVAAGASSARPLPTARRPAFQDERKQFMCCVCRGFTPQTTGNKPQYLTLIRNHGREREHEPFSAQRHEERPIIQIHGSTSDPPSIVFTREGYRSLLHLNPAYSNFIKTVMARSTLLYLGFSFTDGYFNEIRSELMTLRERAVEGGGQPFSYAVICDKPQVCWGAPSEEVAGGA